MRLVPLLVTVCLASRPMSAQTSCKPMKADTGHVALTGLTVWDGTGGPGARGMTVLLKGDRIEAVFPDGSTALPPRARVRRMRGLHAVPGFVDAHVHLATDPSKEDTRIRTERRLCRALLGGVTAVRDMAGDARSLASLQRDALVGDIAAPDIFYSALWAGPGFFADPRTAAASAGGVPGSFAWMRAIDPLTDLRRAVAEARGSGATAIKLYADLSGPLVAAITNEAHGQGLPVWAHAAMRGGASAREVVGAGVDVVSHATLISREASLDSLLADMRARGTLFEPTLFVYRGDKREQVAAEMTRKVHQAGVPIVAGTDSIGSGDLGPWSAPNIHAEMALLVKVGGLSTTEALAAASTNGARALRHDQEFGTITPGRLANLVLLAADPVAEIGNTRSVRWVVKRGAFYRGP